MKKILLIFMSALILLTMSSCKSKELSENQKTELYSYYWESYVDVLQFTKDGKLLRNFEFYHESDSRYTISDGKITMYSEISVEDAMTFDFEMTDGKIKIGELEYRKYQKIPEQNLSGAENQ